MTKIYDLCSEPQKCRLIAEFEGQGASVTCSCEKHRNHLFCEIGCPDIGCDAPMIHILDYPNDLNATMRVARRLPDGFTFNVVVTGNKLSGGSCALICNAEGRNMQNALEN